MALKNVLPLDPVANIIINLSTISAARKKFNLALLIGDVGNVKDFAQARVVVYDSMESIIQAGFKTDGRIYKAASLIFGQQKKPEAVAIGKVDATAQETPLQTLQACREANFEWYVANFCMDVTDDQLLEAAAYVEACAPSTLLAYTTAEDAAKEADGGIFGKIKAKNYRRCFGQYSTTHKDAVCAIIGWAMGAMTASTTGSAYTVAYKREIGVDTENSKQVLTTNDVNNIKANNGNVYINRGTYYNVFEEGKVGDGSWIDEIIYLDKYRNDMQLSIMDLLVGNNKIAQTEGGMTRIKNALKVVCEDMGRVGFIQEGIWKGADMLSLSYGDTLPGGFLIQSDPIDSQSQADRDARIAPAIYVSLKLAGAIHHVTVQVDVNR